MRQWKLKNQLPALMIISVAALMSACGGDPYREPTSVGDSTDGSTGGSTGGSSGSSDNLAPPVSVAFSVTGEGGTTPTYTTTVNTDNVLKVRIKAAPAGQISGTSQYSNFSASYGCVVYKITALGETVTTDALAVNGGSAVCAGAPDEQVIDFSNRLGAGHGSVTITVQAANYDFYYLDCLSSYSGQNYYLGYWQKYPYGCENPAVRWKTVYKTHTVNGELDIQINGTSL